MIESLYVLLERSLTALKGRAYTLDRRVPLNLLTVILLRRVFWLIRGMMKTLFLQGRPALIFMASGVQLRNASMCRFGRGTTLETGVIIDGLSTEGIHLGENVTIGAYSQLRASMLSNLGAGISIGNNSSCEAYSFIGAAGQISIGENVIMGQHVSFHAENHIFERTDLAIRLQGVQRIGIEIEDDCWIGANVVFLDGSHVGRGCVVAAGAVVRGRVPAWSIVGGVPAKLIRSRLANDTQ